MLRATPEIHSIWLLTNILQVPDMFVTQTLGCKQPPPTPSNQARIILKASQAVIPTAASRRRGEGGQEPGLLSGSHPRSKGTKHSHPQSLHIINTCAVGQTKRVS